MGHKVRPDSFRLGIINQWSARWFKDKSFKEELEEDVLIREIVMKKVASAGIVNVKIERNVDSLKIVVKAARPGLVIGRGGKGIEELTRVIKIGLVKLYRKRRSAHPPSINITIDELKRSEISSVNLAQNIAWDLEKRMPYRRAMKKYVDAAMLNREVQGVKIKLSGRLNGAEIARVEWLSKGKLPLQTLRANIDYGAATALTTYGTIGIKVWVYKGEVFKDK